MGPGIPQNCYRRQEEFQLELTPEMFMDRIKHWDERTSTSPSGRHLGHYHALFRPPLIKGDDAAREIFEDKRSAILKIHTRMMKLALKHTHVYKRWRNIMTLMIEKDPGTPLLHRLRVIHLYEMEVNFILAVYTRQMDRTCEENELIHDGVYGNRPGKRCHDPVLVDITQTEYSMITRTPLVKDNLDLSACFDRIMAHLSMIVSQAYGMPLVFTTFLGLLLHLSLIHI